MRRLLLSLLCLALLINPARGANPSDKEPEASLELHGQEFAPELLDATQTLYGKAAAAVAKHDALFSANKLNQLDVNQIGTTYALVVQVRRGARQLMQLGEPAGFEFELRAAAQLSTLNKIISGLQQLPQAKQGLANIKGRADALAKQQQKQIPRLAKFVEQGQLQMAEKELNAIYDDLERFLCFLTTQERSVILEPFREAAGKILPPMEEERKKAALAALEKRRDEIAPALTKQLEAWQAAAASIHTTGKGTIDGKSLTGPELAALIADQWPKLHTAAIAVQGIEAARGAIVANAPTPEATQHAADYARFTSETYALLSQLLAAEANRVAAPQAKPLYLAYLPPLADILNATQSSSAAAAAIQPGLTALVAKSPELAAEVKAAQASSEDLLRWRDRVAGEYAAAKAKEFGDVHKIAHAAFARTDRNSGLFETTQSTAAARLMEPARITLESAKANVVGKRATVADVFALSGPSQAGISQLKDRVYARVTLPLDRLAAESAALERELGVTEQQPALSLAATQTLRAARRGDVRRAGGELTGVFLEGYLTRQATLPEAAARLVPLGTLFPAVPGPAQLEPVLIRFDMKPAWIQGHGFFVDLSRAALPPP